MLIPYTLRPNIAVFNFTVHISRVDFVWLEYISAVDVKCIAVEVVALKLVFGLARCREHVVFLSELWVVFLNLPTAIIF